MYVVSIYIFCFVFLPLAMNLWLLKNHTNKVFVFVLSLDALLLAILVGLGVYYDKIDMLFWNIALTIIMAAIFVTMWIVRRFFTPKIMIEFDNKMVDEISSTKDVIEHLIKQYNKYKKYVIIASSIYAILAFTGFVLHLFNKVEIILGVPLPYIWVAVLLLSAYVACNFNIKVVKLEEEMICAEADSES